jgi:hypothetical protein
MPDRSKSTAHVIFLGKGKHVAICDPPYPSRHIRPCVNHVLGVWQRRTGAASTDRPRPGSVGSPPTVPRRRCCRFGSASFAQCLPGYVGPSSRCPRLKVVWPLQFCLRLRSDKIDCSARWLRRSLVQTVPCQRLAELPATARESPRRSE